MQKEQIMEEVKLIVHTISEIDLENIDTKKSLYDELGMDYWDMLEIFLAIEEKYNIYIIGELNSINTIEDIVDLINFIR